MVSPVEAIDTDLIPSLRPINSVPEPVVASTREMYPQESPTAITFGPEAPKQVLFGTLFGMALPLANKWIHLLLPILNTALAAAGEVPYRGNTPASMGDACEAQLKVKKENIFFMIVQSDAYSVQKTQKLKSHIIAAKRNVIR